MDRQIHNLQGLSDMPHILFEFGVKNIVICPGSRNAPIVNALVSYKKFNCTSLIDERSAAYYAMGMAQKSKKPVAITCTSGTATLNLAPAICEAYYMGIPLIIITADRPIEWLNQADNQTIDQTGIYSNFIKSQVTLPSEIHHIDELWYFQRKISEALITSIDGKPGPVHINLPLREPLYQILPSPSKKILAIRKAHTKSAQVQNTKHWKNKWTAYNKRMVILGMDQGKDEEFNALLIKLSKEQNTVVISENISNARCTAFIDNLESLYAAIPVNEEGKFQPDLLITLGDSLVCKRLKLFLRRNPAKEHWHFSNNASITDTYQQLSTVFDSDPFEFLETVTKDQPNTGSHFNDTYKKQHVKTASILFDELGQLEYSDLKATSYIIDNIPSEWDIHLSNSSAVRLTQIFPTRKDLLYFSNRGTSGIDGSLSTAVGSCTVSNKPTLLLTGDLSFVYDSNGMWNKKLPDNFKIIVLNNQGGNIFQMIKTGETYADISPYLETKHKVNLKHLTEAFSIKHIETNNMKELEQNLVSFFGFNGCAVLEIKTNMETNTKVFKELYNKFTF